MVLPFFFSAQRARWYSFRTPDILQRRYRFSPLQDLSPSPRPCMQQRSLPPFLFHYFHFHTTSASLFVHTQYFLPNAEKKEERGSPTPPPSPHLSFPPLPPSLFLFPPRNLILLPCHSKEEAGWEERRRRLAATTAPVFFVTTTTCCWSLTHCLSSSSSSSSCAPGEF